MWLHIWQAIVEVARSGRRAIPSRTLATGKTTTSEPRKEKGVDIRHGWRQCLFLGSSNRGEPLRASHRLMDRNMVGGRVTPSSLLDAAAHTSTLAVLNGLIYSANYADHSVTDHQISSMDHSCCDFC